MTEYATEAVVLAKEPVGEFDLRVALFTKRYGKLQAKSKSGRKITSKLGPHLDIGAVARIRVVQKHGLQIADALKHDLLRIPASTLSFLNVLLPEEAPEPALWHALVSDTFSWHTTLQILGWDPNEARCEICRRRAPNTFYLKTQEFFCAQCVNSHNAEKEVLYLEAKEEHRR